jgi:hypothetical protein
MEIVINGIMMIRCRVHRHVVDQDNHGHDAAEDEADHHQQQQQQQRQDDRGLVSRSR